MKIKDNLDLQGYLLQNFCVDNYDSLDSISNKGDGRMVFLTGNATDAKYRHVNVWDGTNFKALAYLEDVAMNDDFIALQEKVALLAGDVDTDAIISNMKEVSAFLEGFAEDASLMDLLNSKLSTSGGTINGSLNINKTGFPFIGYYQNDVLFGRIGFNAAGVAVVHDNTDWRTIITSAGGTIEGGTDASPLFINTTANTSRIGFKKNSTTVGYLGFSDTNTPVFVNVNGGAYNLLHANNIGEYAAGALVATSLKGLDLNSLATTTTKRNMTIHFAAGSAGTTNDPFGGGAYGMLNIPVAQGYTLQLAAGTNQNMFARVGDATSWSAWKTLAFTDSDITGNAASASLARKLQTTSGYDYVFASDSSKYILFGYTAATKGYDAYIDANNIYFRISDTQTHAMRINSLGNVTIGGSDLAGTNVKLYVNGPTVTPILRFINNDNTTGSYIGRPSSGHDNILLYIPTANDFYIATNGEERMRVNANGNVLIGTTNDNGAKLQVAGKAYIGSPLFVGTIHDNYVSARATISLITSTNNPCDLILGANNERLWSLSARGTSDSSFGAGSLIFWNYKNNNASIIVEQGGDVHVKGNLIVDGEVSAGGAGEEGETEGGGGREPWASDPFAITSTTMEFSHNLGTDNVIVQVYEQDATSGHWSMILVDVEIIDNANIALHFGRTESTIHKVIVMG